MAAAGRKSGMAAVRWRGEGTTAPGPLADDLKSAAEWRLSRQERAPISGCSQRLSYCPEADVGHCNPSESQAANLRRLSKARQPRSGQGGNQGRERVKVDKFSTNRSALTGGVSTAAKSIIAPRVSEAR